MFLWTDLWTEAALLPLSVPQPAVEPVLLFQSAVLSGNAQQQAAENKAAAGLPQSKL